MSDSSPASGKHMPKDYLWIIRKIGRKSRGSVARRSTVVLFPLKQATLVFFNESSDEGSSLPLQVSYHHVSKHHGQ